MNTKYKLKKPIIVSISLALATATLAPPLFAAETSVGDNPFLQEQYAISESKQLDSLLTPIPQLTQSNQISVKAPEELDLIPIGSKKLHPIKLEATISKSSTLEDLLMKALENNLGIIISKENVKANRFRYASALGRFLPDLSLTAKTQNVYQGGDLVSKIDTQNMTLTYAFFQGGKVFYDSRGRFFDLKASSGALSARTKDVLLDVFKKYNNVLYNQILLHIRLKSLETSRAALSVNSKAYKYGTGTKFAVMQSKAQLASDAQALVAQEVTLRKAKIDLAALLNDQNFENIVPDDDVVFKKLLLEQSLDINGSIEIAVANRPEVKQYLNQWKAAQANTKKAFSALLPVAQLYISPNNTEISSGSGGTNSGTGGGGGNSGSTTGGSSVNLSTSGTGTSSVGLGAVAGKSFSAGLTVSLNLGGLGTSDAATVLANNALAHKAFQEYNLQILSVLQEVRKSFVEVQTAEQELEITNEGAVVARESLRLSGERLKVGIGTNLEYIEAQKTYVNALSTQAKAYIDFQNSQAQLLRDLGVIDINSLTKGYISSLKQPKYN